MVSFCKKIIAVAYRLNQYLEEEHCLVIADECRFRAKRLIREIHIIFQFQDFSLHMIDENKRLWTMWNGHDSGTRVSIRRPRPLTRLGDHRGRQRCAENGDDLFVPAA